ncbi:hypothetical protein F4825DRAFT_417174 [Nemania diffusa]|nr:hypothetical protein F4825DRAFT_417174 [Nemania diffusa]
MGRYVGTVSEITLCRRTLPKDLADSHGNGPFFYDLRLLAYPLEWPCVNSEAKTHRLSPRSLNKGRYARCQVRAGLAAGPGANLPTALFICKRTEPETGVYFMGVFLFILSMACSTIYRGDHLFSRVVLSGLACTLWSYFHTRLTYMHLISAVL